MALLFSGDPSSLSSADAVVFHAFDIDLQNLPQKAKDKQYFIFLIGESAAHSSSAAETPDYFFDMLHSYRLDSDVIGPYRYSVPLETEVKDFAAGKTKLVAWFVSNCKTYSWREDYVSKLKQYVPVDVYGTCGNLKCSRSDEKSCDEKLRKEYKFYLAFENRYLAIDYLLLLLVITKVLYFLAK